MNLKAGIEKGFYTQEGMKLCKTMKTLMDFIDRFSSHRTEILEMIDYKLKDLTNPELWEGQETKRDEE